MPPRPGFYLRIAIEIEAVAERVDNLYLKERYLELAATYRQLDADAKHSDSELEVMEGWVSRRSH